MVRVNLTAWAAVHDALIVMFDAGTTVPVFDTIPNTMDYLPDSIVVGGDVDPTDPTSGAFHSEYRDMGAGASRDESGFVRVAITSQSGDESFSDIRTRCFGIGETLTGLLRADPGFGIMTGRMSPQLNGIEGKTSTGMGLDGPWVSLVLTIHYDAII